MSDDLAEFLLARIGEDELRARLGAPFDKPENHEDDYSRDWHEVHADAWHTDRCGWRRGEGLDDSCTCGVPARVLAECEAKRQIVKQWQDARGDLDKGGMGFDPHEVGAYQDGLEMALRAVAAIYADHADYRAEWRP